MLGPTQILSIFTYGLIGCHFLANRVGNSISFALSRRPKTPFFARISIFWCRRGCKAGWRLCKTLGFDTPYVKVNNDVQDLTEFLLKGIFLAATMLEDWRCAGWVSLLWCITCQILAPLPNKSSPCHPVVIRGMNITWNQAFSALWGPGAVYNVLPVDSVNPQESYSEGWHYQNVVRYTRNRFPRIPRMTMKQIIITRCRNFREMRQQCSPTSWCYLVEPFETVQLVTTTQQKDWNWHVELVLIDHDCNRGAIGQLFYRLVAWRLPLVPFCRFRLPIGCKYNTWNSALLCVLRRKFTPTTSRRVSPSIL